MKRIDTERHKPDPENPNRLIYDGQRTVQEIFNELRYRLESTGYLPDEYFMLDGDWENGREWPESGDIFCTVDYGGSEGIYLDIYMKYQNEKKEWITKNLATGKTLGEAEADMDRMHLISSAVVKAFHSDGVHARYVRVGEQDAEPQDNTVIHLNPEERQIITDSLIETRQRWKTENKPFEKIEQLLRRVIGNITDYLKAVGEKPRTMNDYDTALLAITDGDVQAFKIAAEKVPHAYGNLLVKAAARPGDSGLQMCEHLCRRAYDLSNDIYMQACKNAINTGDIEKAARLMTNANSCVSNLKGTFYGDVILHALSYDEKFGGHKGHMAVALTQYCTSEQISKADPHLLKLAIMSDNLNLTDALLSKNISVTSEPAMLIFAAAQKKDVYLSERLINAGADVNGQHHAALRACMNTNDHATGMFLLKLGADFQGFHDSVTETGRDKKPLTEQETGFLFALKSYWDNNINHPAQGQDDGEPEYGED